MTAETYEEITKIIAKERANLKVWFMKNMGIKFKDKINEEQKQLTKIPM